MAFHIQRLRIPELLLVAPSPLDDPRGFFMEIYKYSVFAAHGIPAFVQDNYSHSRRGSLRGLHFQKRPKGQGKLVTVLHGEIFDVAVDIRKGSPSYGQWVGQTLSGDNLRLLYIPEGFAHGFCVLSDDADVLYKVTAEYAPELDRGIAWNDQEIGVAWPVRDPVLSGKDATLPRLQDADNNFIYGEPA